MNDSDQIFAAKYALGIIESHDILKFADRKLMEGYYSDTYLEIIDSEYKVLSELAPLLELSLKEISITIPKFEQAVWVMLKYHIELIAESNVNPRLQFSQLLNDIEKYDLTKDITNYVGDNIGIETMYGLFHDDYLTDEEVSSDFKNESIKWMAKYG